MSIVQTNLSTLIDYVRIHVLNIVENLMMFKVQDIKVKRNNLLFLIASLRKNDISSDCTYRKYVYYIYIEV